MNKNLQVCSRDLNTYLLGIQMVQTCIIVEWSSVTHIIGWVTDGLNNKLLVGNSSHNLNITGHRLSKQVNVCYSGVSLIQIFIIQIPNVAGKVGKS